MEDELTEEQRSLAATLAGLKERTTRTLAEEQATRYGWIRLAAKPTREGGLGWTFYRIAQATGYSEAAIGRICRAGTARQDPTTQEGELAPWARHASTEAA